MAEVPPDFMEESRDQNIEKFEYELHDLEILGRSIDAEDKLLDQLSERIGSP